MGLFDKKIEAEKQRKADEREIRKDARDDRKEIRQDARDDRKEARQEARGERKDARQDKREEMREIRAGKRDDLKLVNEQKRTAIDSSTLGEIEDLAALTPQPTARLDEALAIELLALTHTAQFEEPASLESSGVVKSGLLSAGADSTQFFDEVGAFRDWVLTDFRSGRIPHPPTFAFVGSISRSSRNCSRA